MKGDTTKSSGSSSKPAVGGTKTTSPSKPLQPVPPKKTATTQPKEEVKVEEKKADEI